MVDGFGVVRRLVSMQGTAFLRRTIFDGSLETLHLLNDCYQDCIRKSTVIGTV